MRRAALVAVFVNAAVLPTAAFAHPHVAGDPFADVGDTIVAGSAKVAPIRGPSHRRWTVTDVRGGARTPAGTIEQRVTRADTPAGRQWCVATHWIGSAEAIDSVFLSAGPPIPVAWLESRGTFTFDGRDVTGPLATGRSIVDVTVRLAHASYPAPLERFILSRLTFTPGSAVAIAFFEPDRFREYHLAVEVVGETRIDHDRHERRCWLLVVADDVAVEDVPETRPFRPKSRTVWIDRNTGDVLREEIRNAAGDLLQVIEAE